MLSLIRAISPADEGVRVGTGLACGINSAASVCVAGAGWDAGLIEPVFGTGREEDRVFIEGGLWFGPHDEVFLNCTGVVSR